MGIESAFVSITRTHFPWEFKCISSHKVCSTHIPRPRHSHMQNITTFFNLCWDQKAFCWPAVLSESSHVLTGLLVLLGCVVTAFSPQAQLVLSVLIPVHLFQFILRLTDQALTGQKPFLLQHGLSAEGRKSHQMSPLTRLYMSGFLQLHAYSTHRWQQFHEVLCYWYWWGSGHTTPKYDTLACCTF